MAIEFWLELATDLSRVQAARLLAEGLPGEQANETFVLRPDILVSVIDSTVSGKEITLEAFGFTPDLTICFRQEYGVRSKDFNRAMLRATLLLLEHGRDAVLLFNGEIITLQRLGGQLVFNSDPNIALNEELIRQEVHVPYERRSLPSPLV